MSDLPIDRVTNYLRSFTNTGVEYFGPIEARMFRRTVNKWVCLFTGLSVREVHLELVDSLDTASCVDAVHRFIGRRGQPKTITSDNGTNFVGAAWEFKECFGELQSKQAKKTSNELHDFGDAFAYAFFSVAYLVTETRKAEQAISFIMSKPQMSPVKHHATPKLE